MSLHLTADELAEVTGFKQKAKVRSALLDMGITFKVRSADGFALVDRDHYKAIMSGGAKPAKKREPNWQAGYSNGQAAHL